MKLRSGKAYQLYRRRSWVDADNLDDESVDRHLIGEKDKASADDHQEPVSVEEMSDEDQIPQLDDDEFIFDLDLEKLKEDEELFIIHLTVTRNDEGESQPTSRHTIVMSVEEESVPMRDILVSNELVKPTDGILLTMMGSPLNLELTAYENEIESGATLTCETLSQRVATDTCTQFAVEVDDITKGIAGGKANGSELKRSLKRTLADVTGWVRRYGDIVDEPTLQVLQMRLDVSLRRVPDESIDDILPPGVTKLVWEDDEMARLDKRFNDNWRIEGDLRLDGNLDSLPDSFGGVHVGGDLNLFKSQLSSLPDSFGGVRVGGSLNLNSNRLTSLPDSFGGVRVGGSLYLVGNNLTSLPELFGGVRVGGHLNLYTNRLTSLPDSFGGVRVEGELGLHRNQLTSLPDSFGKVHVGGDLSLYTNQLTSLPDSFGEMHVGGRLDLRRNRLTSLPDSFGKVRMRGDLDLDGNQLTSLPDSFGGVRVGGELYLENNQLTSLPDFNNVEGTIHR